MAQAILLTNPLQIPLILAYPPETFHTTRNECGTSPINFAVALLQQIRRSILFIYTLSTLFYSLIIVSSTVPRAYFETSNPFHFFGFDGPLATNNYQKFENLCRREALVVSNVMDLAKRFLLRIIRNVINYRRKGKLH